MPVSRVEFRILGPLEIRVDGVSAPIGGRKQRALLAMLLLSANRVVSRQDLIGDLFAGRTRELADHALRNHVSRLRKLLSQVAADEPRLVARPPGYLLRVEPGELDLEVFEQLVAGGRASLAAGDAAAAAESLRAAEALWAGQPLANVDFELSRPEVERLEEIRLAAVEQRIEAELALGKQDTLVAELEQLADAYPFRERFRAQLMLALYRSGRQAEGLGVYRRTRAFLREELALEPGVELQQLERAILVHDPTLNGGTDGARVRAPLRDVCPFKGLAPFEQADAEFFFGRERLVDELTARLADTPFLALVGPSGSGKSSLLRAGLLSAVEDDSVLIRPGARPAAELEAALARCAGPERRVLAVDQFEELFATSVSEHERTTFINSIVEAAWEPDRRLVVVLALRADFFAGLAAYAELADLVGPNHVLLGPMSKAELRRAIEGPAERTGLEIEAALIETLVDDVVGEAGALPLLSTALLDLWHLREGRQLTLGAYERTGGVRGAVGRYAEAAYQSLSDEGRQIARRILLRLVAGGDAEPLMRRRVTRVELDVDDDEEIAGVVTTLVERRLLVADNGNVELVHDALLERWSRLAGWLDENIESRRLHRQLTLAASEWQTDNRDPSALYRGARLAAALDWAAENTPDLNQLERRFLDESRAASVQEATRQRRANRRLRLLLAVAAALVVVAVAAAAVALQKRSQARREATAALAQRLGAQALIDPSLDQSLLLAREGVHLDNSEATRSNLLATLMRSPAAIGVAHEGSNRLLDEALSPDGHTLAVRGEDGNVAFFDTRTLRQVGSPLSGQSEIDIFSGVAGPLRSLAYSPNGKSLVIGSTTGSGPDQAATITLVGAHARTAIPSRTSASITADVAYAPDGRTFATGEVYTFRAGGPAEVVVVRDARTADARAQSKPIPQARLAGYTADGRFLLILTAEREAVLLDARTLKRARIFRLGGTAAATSPSVDDVAFGHRDGTVTLLDLRTGKTRTFSGKASGSINGLSFSRDGTTLATTADDGTVSVWNIRRASLDQTLHGHASAAEAAVFSPDDRTLYTTSYDGNIIVWDLGGQRRLGRPFRFSARGRGASNAAAVSPDGTRFALSPAANHITLWDAVTHAPTGRELRAPIGHVNDIAFSRDGKLIAAAGSAQVAVWSTRTRKLMRRIAIGGDGAAAVSFSPTSPVLAIGWIDSMNVLYNLETGRRIATLTEDWGTTGIDYSPDGTRLASAGVGGTTIWNVEQQSAVAKIDLGAFAARYSPDGKLIAVGDTSGAITLWELAPNHRFSVPGQTLEGVLRIGQLRGQGGPVHAIDFNRSGNTLVSLSDDGKLRLWDVATQKLIGAPLPGASTAGTAHFFPDGKHIIATSQTGTAIIWNVDPRALETQACNIANRNLTRAEWRQFVGNRTYQPTCS